MSSNTEEEFNVEQSNAKFVKQVKNTKNFSLFPAGNNLIKKKEKKDLFDEPILEDKKIADNDIYTIENKFSEILPKGQEEFFQRENYVTLNDFKIPNKKITEEQNIIINDMNEQGKKRKENEKEIKKENKLRNIQRKKNEGEIKEYYKEVKEKINTKIDGLVKAKTRSFKRKLTILAVFCLFVAFLLIIYLIVHEKIFELMFG